MANEMDLIASQGQPRHLSDEAISSGHSSRPEHLVGAELDVAVLWSEFDDSPIPSPYLPHDHECWRSLGWGTQTNYSKPLIECIVYPRLDREFSISWCGPDPLSPNTSADSVLSFMSIFVALDALTWVDIRLCRLSQVTGEIIQQYAFFLPCIQPDACQYLPRIQREVQDILSRQTAIGLQISFFRLYMCPRSEASPQSDNCKTTPYFVHPIDSTALDPNSFVQNITANFA